MQLDTGGRQMPMHPIMKRPKSRDVLAMAAIAGLVTCPAPWAGAADRPEDSVVSDYLARNPQSIERIVENYLVSNPEVIEKALKELLRRRTEKADTVASDAIKANREKLFANRDDVVLGNPDGDVTLVEFFDFNCHFCRSSVADLIKLIDGDPKLRVVLKEMPVLGANSLEAARVSAGVRQQSENAVAYRDFYVRLLSEKGNLGRERAQDIAADLGIDMKRLERDYYSMETSRLLQDSLDLARDVGINGTPSYVIGTILLKGAVGLDRLKREINLARSR